jgi:hypothetical protein
MSPANEASRVSIMELIDSDMASSVFAVTCWRKIDSPEKESAGRKSAVSFRAVLVAIALRP